MRTLWLHIGSHKTGTTALQSGLLIAKRKKALGPFSYCHVEEKSHCNAIVDAIGDNKEMRWTFNRDILEQSMPEKGNVIVSAERLFWLDEQAEIEKLAEYARRNFDDVKVVAYLRRQDELAVSFRKTTVITGVGRRFFGDRIGSFPEYHPHMDRYFCYAEKLELWENVFGAENVIVRKYQKSDLSGDDTLSDFFSVIGLECGKFVTEKNTQWNRSQLAVGMWLQHKGYSKAEILCVIKGIEDDQRMLPARAEAMAFMRRFAASNARLALKYDPTGPSTYFDEDFSKFPEQGNDNLENLTVDLKDIERSLVPVWKKRLRRWFGRCQRRSEGPPADAGCQRRSKNRPRGGAKPGQWRGVPSAMARALFR
jgi:hypothetical protein